MNAGADEIPLNKVDRLQKMSPDQLKSEEQRQREQRRLNRLMQASGPPVELRGKLLSAETLKPLEHCHVSYTGTNTLSDAQGGFVLPNVPSDGSLRIRIQCEGWIERHALSIPAVTDRYTLPQPIVFGIEALDLQNAAQPEDRSEARSAFDEAVDAIKGVQTHAQNIGQLRQNEAPHADDADDANEKPGASTPKQTTPTTPAAAATTVPSATSAPAQVRNSAKQSVSGGLSNAQVLQHLRQNAASFHGCYNEALRTDRHARFDVKASWSIQPDGSVSNARLVQSEVQDKAANQCFVRRLSRLRFPSTAENTEVSRDFVFGFLLKPEEQFLSE